MANLTSGRKLLRGFLATAALLGGLFATAAHAELYNGTPVRTIGPFTSGQTNPVPAGGWNAGHDQVVGASLGGQGGWAAACSPNKFDEGITSAVARTGLQSWRVSNWFHDGCVNALLSPAFASVGESAGPTGSVTSSFWFQVPAGNAGLALSTSLGDAAGQRMTYAAIRDDGGSLTVQVVGINQGAGFLGAPLPAPFDDAGVEYDIRSSSALAHGQWYRLRVTANLVIGPRDDVVTYDVLDAVGAVVWTSGAMRSWEDAYLAGVFSPLNTKVTISRLNFRIVENPDDANNRLPYASYALNRPAGLYIDDLNVSPGGGAPLNVGFEGDRYLSDTGTDSGTCGTATPAAARCRTLAYALSVAQPYNTIHVASGNYDGSVVVNKAGLLIVGEGASKPILTKSGGSVDQRILFVDNARNVQIRNLEFQADKTYVGAALAANGDIEGLVVAGNDFRQRQSNVSVASAYGRTNAIAINYSSEGGTADGRSVLIEGNTVHAASGPGGTVFRAGVQLDRGLGIIRNNTITSISQDIAVRFATVVPGTSTSTSVEVHNNTLLGGGAQIASPNAGPVSIDFHHNTVTGPANASALAQGLASPNPADLSLMRVVSNDGNVAVTIRDNSFSGHGGGYRGVLIQNFPNVSLLRNIFTPEAGVADFASLVISNKELANAPNPANPPRAFNLVAQGNTFKASTGSVFKGRAVEFINDNDGSAAAAVATLSFGGAGALANTFDGNHRWYFRLDDQNCDFASGTANCGTLNYPGVSASIPPTQIRPFRFDINATQNVFAGVAPTNPAQVALRQRTYDKLANLALGIVSYNVAANQPVVYVDDDWASNVYGDPLSFTSAAAGTVAVQFGINAFATLSSALMHVEAAGTVHVAKGSYAESVLLDKQVQVIGDGQGSTVADGTILTGGVTIAGSGASAAPADRLSLNNLRVNKTGAASVGVNFSVNASHVSLQNVTVTGAETAGIQFPGVTLGDIKLDYVTANGNPGTGLRASTTTRAANVAISNSEFSDNGAGIILFGATNSGDGQITNWSITDSRFLRNDNADTSTFGGGLWLKTGGAGSLIDGFVIQRSRFEDNGSVAPLNRVGITIRARVGTTLTNVSICDNNVFAETGATGTQLTGINVYDQTGNTGYSPVTVCSNNDFTGVATSISGLEQKNANNTQPIVNISGGPIANTQFINGFVQRIRGGTTTTFNTINAALVGVLAGDIIHAPEGLYSETVTLPAGVTLRGDGATKTLINGAAATGHAVTVAVNASDVTIRELGISNVGGSCIFASNGADRLRVEKTSLSACGRHGLHLEQLPGNTVDGVTIHDNDVFNIGSPGNVSRGIVLWNGSKKNITITDNRVRDIATCCGIELQAGTATGVTVTGNTVTNVGDSGMGFIGLTGGSATGNVISNNTITNTGRFGIEIKLPNGNGQTSGDGSIVVSGNTITHTGVIAPGELRDKAGIAVLRRDWDSTNVNIPTGVVVTGNTVSGFRQASDSDGFGIAIEGTQMSAAGNILSNNDVGLQTQAGHLPYAANSGTNGEQANLVDTYFGRGNSPSTCVDVGSNNFSGVANGLNRRDVGILSGPVATNANTGRFHCTVQAAIDDPLTLAGHVIEINDGSTVAEQITVNKGVRLTSQSGSFAPATLVAPATLDGGAEALLRVVAAGVTIDNLKFQVDLSRLGSAIVALNSGSNNFSNLWVHHNSITGTGTATAAFGKRHAISLNGRGFVPSNDNALAGIVVEYNDIGISGSPTAVAAGTPFASGLEFDDASATPSVTGPFGATNTPVLRVANNRIAASSQDANLRYNNGRVVVTANTFHGAGLDVGEAQGLFEVTGNTFDPLGPALRSLGIKSVQHSNAYVHVAGNTFRNHAIGVAVQNSRSWHLLTNTFAAGAGNYVHLSINSRPLGGVPGAFAPFQADVQGNSFAGSSGGRAVVLGDHDYRAARGVDVLDFGTTSANSFSGAFDYYFWLDASDCPSTHSTTGCVAPFGNVYATFYPLVSSAPSVMKPFPANVVASNNTFAGKLPSVMDLAEITALQARTFHDDPLFPETSPGAAPSALGRVEFGLASSIVPTTTKILSALPAHGVVGTPVTVTVNVITTGFAGNPSGTVTVTGLPDGGSCQITYSGASGSCPLPSGFATGGLKTITASFADDEAGPSTAAPVVYQVFSTGPTPTTEVTPVTPGSETATDNDYSRINNAVQLLQSGDTLVLNGSFVWTPVTGANANTHAYDAWLKGSDGIAGNGDDWSIKLPATISDATIRAIAPGAASILGNEGGLPADTTSFVTSYGTINQGWTFQDLTLRGFDFTFAMYGNGTGSLSRTRYLGNVIHIGVDSGDDYANYGIYSGYGEAQAVTGNQIFIDIAGANGMAGINSRAIGVQIGDSCNGACFNGLLVNNNTITVVGTPASGGGALPPKVIGIWENGGDVNSSVRIQDNVYVGSGSLDGSVAGNRQTGMVATTQSNGARQSVLSGNRISGASIGLRGQVPEYAHYVGSDAPLLVEGNTFLNNGTALHLPAGYPQAAKYDIRVNRLSGNDIGIFAERADDLPLPGDPGYGGDELPSQIAANDNWWGCNEGPVDVDCDSVTVESGADSAVVSQTRWLKLNVSASPTTIAADDTSISTITTTLESSSGSVDPLVLTRFPAAQYGFASSLGSVSPTSITSAAGTAQAALKSAIAGGALVTTTLDNGSASTNVLVTNAGGPPNTVTITPTGAPSASDNDYTRINNAVQAVTNGTTVVLSGNFNWSETNAALSWAKGSDGIAGTGDDYAIEPPRNLSGVTITAPTPGAASIVGPGDLPGVNLEGVFSLYGGSFRGWTFSNLDISGFDLAIGMFFNGGPLDAFDNVKVLDNTITIPDDLNTVVAPLDVNQNIGIHYAFGRNQQFAGNTFNLSSNGVSNGVNYSTSIAMQSNTSGGGRYDGLRIHDNVVRVTGSNPLGANPPRLYGIWENAQDFTAGDIQVFDNAFLNDTGAVPPANNLWRGFMLTSQSAGVSYRNNTVRGASVGFTTIIGAGYTPAASSAATVLEGNTLVDNLIGIRVDSDNGDAKVTARFNRIAGTGIGVQQLGGIVDVRNNWWGCNGGPGAAGCTTLAGSSTVSPWLKLAVSASPTTFVAGTPSGSVVTTTLVNNTDNNVPSGMGAFPLASYGYSTSLGAVAPSSVDAADGLAQSTLTSATAGGALVTTTLDSGSASTNVLVTNPGMPLNTVTVTPATSPTAVDNDYTRINNAVRAVTNGTTVVLSGNFNWSETNAALSWAKGSDGIGGNGDDYAVEPPRNLDGVTITAAMKGGSTVSGGATIGAGGDLAGANLEGVFSLYGGSFRNWTISNLELTGFDLAIGLFFDGGPIDAFEGAAVTGNIIRVPADGADANQNIGLHFSFGKNQTIADNAFYLDAAGAFQGPVGMQSSTSGGAAYDGLEITGNTFTVTGTPDPVTPARVVGIWENDQAQTGTDVRISDNRFIGQPGVAPAAPGWIAIQTTSHSGAGKRFEISANTVNDFSVGITTLFSSTYVYSPVGAADPVEIQGNTLVNNRIGVRTQSTAGNAKSSIQFNRIVGTAGSIGVQQSGTATVSAPNNWWGCNAGPGASGCTSVDGTAVSSPHLLLSIASDTAVVGAGGLALLTASVNGNSNGDDLSGTTAFPVTSIAFSDNSSATLATPTALTGSTASTRGIAGNTLSGIQTVTIATATLDSQPVSTTINVNQVSLHVDLPAAGVVGITSAPFPLVIDNNGATLTESSKVYLTIKRTPALASGNVLLEYQSPSNPSLWLPVTLTLQSGSTDTLIGQMSVGTLAAGSLTVNLRATSTVAGTIEFFAILVGDTSNALYSSDGGSVAVATSADVKIALVSGSPQSAQVNTAYVAPLVIKVTDTAGNPLANVPVTFTAPATGATVSYASGSGVTAVDGTLSSGAITANSTAGAVTTAQASVAASACSSPITCTVNFSLTNTVTGSGAGLLMTGDTVGVVTLPSAAPIHSSSTATVQLSAAAPTENVVAHLTISRPGGITPADLSIDYRAITQEFAACTPATPSGFWCPLTLTQLGSNLVATFGPASGFPLVDDAASTFRTRYHRGGQYTVTTTMDGVGSNQTYASGTGVVAVADLDLSGTPGASSGNTGVALDSAVSLINSGSAPLGASAPTPNNRDVIGEFTITPATGSVTPAQVVVRYFDGSNYVAIATSQSGNAITGTFGGSGFPVAAGYSATSLFRTTFLVAGNYTVTTRIIGAVSATDVFAETVQTASIGTSSSTIAIDPASLSQTYNTLAHPVIVSTTPSGLAYTLTYTGVTPTVYATSSTPPTNAGSYAVVATITSPGYSGTANATLVVGKAASTVTIAGSLTQDFGATTALTATAAPISTGSVSITYNGSATTPTAVGSYAVVATLVDPNYTGSATATLVVRDAANVEITFTAPEMSLVTPATAPFSTQTPYSGTLVNTGGSTSQKVHYRITAVRIDDGNGTAGLPPAIDADDVEVCLFDPSGWAAQGPSGRRNCPTNHQSLFISRSTGSLNGRASVSFRYPNLAANDDFLGNTSTPLPPTLFQFKRGEYRVQVDVVGSDNNTIYATASDTTSVPQAAVAYNGATSGPTEQALLSTTNLSNTGGRVVGNVIVRVTLSDAASAALTPAAADFAYLDGSTFVTLPWTVSGTNLVTEFGPPVTGFELLDGHNQNTAGRGIFHRAGSYGLRYEVVDIATRTVIHATEQETLTIGPNVVNFALSDLDQVYNGTPRDITVSPANVPHTVVYDASCPAIAPAATPANQVAPTDAGSYCVYVAATGSYVGSAGGTLVVAKASAPVSLTGAVGSTVSRTYSGVPQTVLATTTATLAPGGNITVSYNGSSTPPAAAGSYSLVATIVDTNYQGSTTGTLVISIAGGATITLDGGSPINRSYTGSQQAPVTATTSPAIAYTVTYAGSGATVYPLTATPPTAVGSYAVVATTADANYAPVSASGTLVVANASSATLGFSATPSSLAVNATSLTSATLANSGGPIGENVLVRYTITRDVAGLVPADIALRYNAGSLQPLGLSQIGSSLVGYFGPQPGGFPVAAGYSATTAGDAVFHVAGVYSLTLDLVGVTTSTVFATTSSTVTVGQGSGTISINASTLNAIYNGSPRPVTVTTSPAGLAYTLSYTGMTGPAYPTNAAAPANAGTYSVVATLNDPNYSGSDTQTLSIAKAVSPVSFAGSTNVVYTGSAQSPLTATLTLESGNTAACTIVYTPVATPTNIGTYTATATCNGINYTGSASTTLTISASNATVTLSNLAQTYDGTPRPVTVTTNPVGLTTTVTYNGGAVPTNAGTYNVVATITSPGYSGTTSGTLIVDKAVATVVIGNLSHVYTGAAKTATATTTPPGVPVTFTYNGSATAPVNAGSYTVVATANGPNHAGTATATLVIAKAVATVTLSDLGQTYNGTPRPVTVTTSPSGLAVSVTYAGSPTAPTPVGSYAVVATIVDANHQGSESGTLVIGKATATVTLLNLAQNYTGSPISAVAITSPAGLGVTLTYDGSTTPPTAVGNYIVQATVVDANYNGSGSGTLSISQSAATVTLSNLSQVYTGAPKAVTVVTNPLGLPRTITYDGSSTPPSAVGSYNVVVTLTDPSYTGSASGVLTITKATAPVTLTGLSQIFDGTPRIVTATTVPSGLTVAITYDGSATAPTNTGTYAVVATVNDSTYQGTANGTLVVTNGNATVNVSNLSHVYDGSAKSATITTNPAGLTTSVTYNGIATLPINAGTYTVVATITSAGYSGSGAGTLIIEKANAAVVIGNLTHVYTGAAKTATATTTPAGVPVTFTYNGSATAPVNAGSYTVLATASNANYSGSATATLVIAKAVATVTLSDLGQTYNGTPRPATVTTSPAGLATSVSYNGNTIPPLAVGSYAVVATIVDANHQGSESGTLVIGKATATVTLGNLAQTYTGSPISATAFTTPTGLTVDLLYNGNPVAPTAVGSYTVQATINDASYSGTGSATLTIGKATATVVVGNLSQVFDGAPKAVSVTTTPAGLPHTVSYDGTAAVPSAVGSYAVVVTVNDPSYSGSATATLTITKGAATVSLSNLSQIYDGTPRVVAASTVPSGLAVTVTYDGSTTPPTSTGSYAVIATVNDATWQGSASGTLVVTNGNATIALSNLVQTYNGSPRPVTATTTPTGLTTSISYDGSATAPTNAGTYTVVATVTSAGYSGTASGTLVINKAAATVTLASLAQVYNATPRPVTATTNPVGLTVNFTYAGSATAPTNAGTYLVTGTISDSNYQGSATGNLVVSKAVATLALSGTSQTYSGSPRQVTVVTTPASLPVVVTYNSSLNAPIDAGSYPVVATINDTNYQGTLSGTLVVGKAAATVTLSNLSQSFNGTPRPVAVTTSPAGLATTITYNGAATVPTLVGSYAVQATISNANYEGSANGTLVIDDGSAAITLTGLSYVYDGSPKSATATTNPTGLAVAFTYDGSATPPTNAGSYAVVASITSSGYSGTASGTLIISKATATVTLASLNPTYDGTPKPATATTSPTGLSVGYTYDGAATAPTNAGTYLVVATITDSNYSGTATATLTIAKATATVTLGGLSQAYNGSPRTVIVTTTPSGLANAVTYNGSATAPSAVGTYAVSATVTNPNYTGSAVGTLTITSGSAGSIAANGPTSYTGNVSQPITGALPSVLVTDVGGNPVAGIVVTFTAGANSGSLSGATQTTGSNGVATLGGWVLGATAPTQTVTATGASVPGSVVFTATAGGNVVLSVTIDSGRQYVRAGQSISHLVAVGNAGSLLASGVSLASSLPAELDAASLQWICVPSAGSSCGSATSGTGNLPASVNIAAGGNVSFVLSGTVLAAPTDLLTYAVNATRPVGSTGSNGSASRTTTVVIFRDGFEQGGDGAQWPTGSAGSVSEAALGNGQIVVLNLDGAGLAPGVISTLARGAGGSFRVEASWIAGQAWLRLVSRDATGEVASDWVAIDRDQGRIALSHHTATGRLLLVAGDVSVDLPIQASGLLTVYSPLH